jgi:hypothetical protein
MKRTPAHDVLAVPQRWHDAKASRTRVDMSLTGRKSVKTVVGYYYAGEVTQSRAARLLNLTDKPNENP